VPLATEGRRSCLSYCAEVFAMVCLFF
jgi:hypothetical protein